MALSAGSGTPGTGVVLNLTMADPNNAQPASLQWVMTYPTVDFSGVTVAVAGTASTAGKTVTCNNTVAGTSSCVLYGVNETPIVGGLVAQITLTISSSTLDITSNVQLTSGEASSPMGGMITSTNSGSTVTIVQPTPTLSGVACLPASVLGGQSSTCTVTLSAFVTSGTFTVTTSDNTTSLVTVPPSVTVSLDHNTATFTATTVSTATTTAVTITAIAAGVTKTTTLTVTAAVPSTMTANAGTTPQSAAINTAFTNALAVTVKDASSNPVSGVNVTFTAPGSGASGVFSNSTATITVATNSSGIASAPFTAKGTSGGPYTVTAAATGLTTVNFSLTNTTGTPSTMTANAGTTPQSALINTAFTNALAVTVKDAGSNPVSGVNVTFTAPGSGATGVFSNSTATITVATNSSGVASAPFTAKGTSGGPYTVTAAASGLTTVNFSLTNTAGGASTMTANAGSTPQSAVINTAFGTALGVTVKDAGGNPLSGVIVTFMAPGSGASGVFSNATATIAVSTNASGVGSATFTANGTAGGPYTVTASASGVTSVTFSLTNTAGAPATMTANAGTTPQSGLIDAAFSNALAVTVKDAASNPVSGVNVTFMAPGSGASGLFSNLAPTITAATNASGVASVPFSANATVGGPYAVTAAATGLATVTFSLTNTACSYTLNPPARLFTAGGGSTTVTVTTGNGCAWTATTNAPGWITLQSGGVSGNGNGSFIYSVVANPALARLGTITVGNASFVVMEGGLLSNVPFTDVPPSDPYFDYVSLMSSNGITVGCQTSPAMYCPAEDVTRAQMAVFIVRGIDLATNTALTYPTTAYFGDVPASGVPDSQYFDFVQRIAQLGITVGCQSSPALYCPDESITQGQMAVFVIRSWMYITTGNATGTFTYPPTPYFTDVPATDQFFAYVQKMAQLGFWTGCGGGTYCENSAVTRDQMAPMIMRSALGAP